jgi:CBS domain-containing protein
MTNAITDRVERFLAEQPPFSLLSERQRSALAGQIVIRFFEKNTLLFKEKDPPGTYVYLIREGSVRLEQDGILYDLLGSGELVGIRSLLSGMPYKATAVCAEECLLYLIPVTDFRPIMDESPALVAYFAQNLASGPPLSEAERAQLKWEAAAPAPGNLVKGHAPVITCGPETNLQEAASIMLEKRVSSLFVCNEQHHPIGILTDFDLRKAVAHGIDTGQRLVSERMSSPVRCVKPGMQTDEVLGIMLESKINHLGVTEKGSPDEPLLAVITRQDLLLAQGWNPFRVVESLKRSASEEEMSELRDKAEEMAFAWLDADYPLPLVNRLITGINDALMTRAVEMAFETCGLNPADYRYCWLSLGSEARMEQFLRTDQDNALLFEPLRYDQETTRAHLLKMAAEVNRILAVCGFVYCPAEVMARNPAWCLSLQEWQRTFHKWIDQPDPQAIRYTTIFFDWRAICGHTELPTQLRLSIQGMLERDKHFLTYLAKDACEAPIPIGFFNQLVLDKNGHDQAVFDIKARGMMPLADAARVLALNYGFWESPNTIARFEYAAQMDQHNGALYQDAAKAYAVMLKTRAQSGRKNSNDGRYIPIEQLGTLERQMLRAAFRPASEIQKLLRIRFSTNLLG